MWWKEEKDERKCKKGEELVLGFGRTYMRLKMKTLQKLACFKNKQHK